MRLAVMTGGFLLLLCATGARAADDGGEVPVDAARLPNVRSLEAALRDAQDQAGTVHVAQLLAVLPLAPADLARMDAAYPNGLYVGCPAGACKLDGTGTAARAPLDATGDDLRGVVVGIRAAVTSDFKVVPTAHGMIVSVCNVGGVYFARAVFRKYLANYQFIDEGGDTITAR